MFSTWKKIVANSTLSTLYKYNTHNAVWQWTEHNAAVFDPVLIVYVCVHVSGEWG